MIKSENIFFRWDYEAETVTNKVFVAEHEMTASIAIDNEVFANNKDAIIRQASDLLIHKILDQAYGDIRQEVLKLRHQLDCLPSSQITAEMQPCLDRILAITEGRGE